MVVQFAFISVQSYCPVCRDPFSRVMLAKSSINCWEFWDTLRFIVEFRVATAEASIWKFSIHPSWYSSWKLAHWTHLSNFWWKMWGKHTELAKAASSHLIWSELGSQARAIIAILFTAKDKPSIYLTKCAS